SDVCRINRRGRDSARETGAGVFGRPAATVLPFRLSFSVESLVAPALAGPSRSAVAGRVGTPGLVERPRRRDRRAGFTLVEMLLVFALIAMFATLFVVNAGALMQQSAAQVVETRFWEAVREARSRAILDRVAHSVRFDDDATAFVVTNVRSGAERL